MNKRSLSDGDFCSNKKNKINLHTYSKKRCFYDGDDESSNKKIKCKVENKQEFNKSRMLIEDIKCDYCEKFLHLHTLEDKANCAWLPKYDELMGCTSKMTLSERIG